MMERDRRKARSILRRLEQLAAGRVNDAVKLVYLDEASRDEIDGLDLTALTEFKRSASGAVEIKLSDRAALLERIYRLMQEDEDAGEAFLRALEGDGNST